MNFFKIILAVLVALALSFWNAFAYVSPGAPTGYVNDYTGTLSTQTKAELENLLKSFKESGAGEISVAMISSLGGDTIDNYALSLGREWGIGQKGKDNGALLLIAKDDRELRIEVGYGFEGVLTDIKSSRIIREVVTPRFKEGNYDAGVVNGVKEMVGLLNPTLAGGAQSIDYTKAPASNTKESNINGFIFFGAMVMMWVTSVLARSKSWWAGGVIGGAFGLVVSSFTGFLFTGAIATGVLVFLGLLFDYFISRSYTKSVGDGTRPPWWTGGGGFGGGSSGAGSSFGGFGGGSFGGGGASGRW